MQKGRASGKEARPFCINLVLQGKTQLLRDATAS